MKIKLGQKVKDSITGYTGIVIARSEWLYGCIRITVQSEKLQDNGFPIDDYTFDEPQAILIEDAKQDKPKPAHGYRKTITRATDPTK